MHKLKVVIADDEPDALGILGSLLSEIEYVEIVAQTDKSIKVESLINKHNPDALFIDINMPVLNGISLLENIRQYNLEIPVVMVTAYEKYMTEAIKLNVFSYLLKPVDRVELSNLADNLYKMSLKRSLDKRIDNKFKIPVKDGLAYLNHQDVFYLEADGNYTRIFTVKGDELVSSYNLGRVLERLPERFFRINRSTVLNADLIFKINKKKNTCTARYNGKVYDFEVSNAFITWFNKMNI